MDAEYDAGGDSFGSIFGDLLEGLGREVGAEGGSIGKVRKAGAYVLEELLEFLDPRTPKTSRGADADWDGTKPAEELRFAREELATLKALEETMRAESQTWEQQAEACKASGDSRGELDAMRKAFDARERRANVRRRVVRAEEKVEYLEKVVFEVERRQRDRAGQRAQEPIDSPGVYTILHDHTKVASTRELTEDWVAELSKGTVVRVVEVISSPAVKRVRGRLENPTGWISLLNVETGYRWAAKAPSGGVGATRAPTAQALFDADQALQELKSRKAGGS